MRVDFDDLRTTRDKRTPHHRQRAAACEGRSSQARVLEIFWARGLEGRALWEGPVRQTAPLPAARADPREVDGRSYPRWGPQARAPGPERARHVAWDDASDSVRVAREAREAPARSDSGHSARSRSSSNSTSSNCTFVRPLAAPTQRSLRCGRGRCDGLHRSQRQELIRVKWTPYPTRDARARAREPERARHFWPEWKSDPVREARAAREAPVGMQ